MKDVEITFDEVVSELPKGAANLDELVFVSPRAKDVHVGWHRDRITIRPKGGWKPNTVYAVQLSPGLQDLRNNAIDSSVMVVFSTGGAIPGTNIEGVAFDWIGGRGANSALIEAIAKDSTIYQVRADSVGRFNLRYVPIGEYVIRSVLDKNNNRLLDPTEGFDTVRVTLTQRVDVELYAFPHDTVGLRIADVTPTPADSLRVLKITFDKPLAPGQTLTRPQFTLKRADSTNVDVVFVETAAEKIAADSIRAKRKADSIAATVKPDTSAEGRARADSVLKKQRADSVAAAEIAAREARRLAALRGNRPAPVRDTTPPPKMNRPTVSTDVYITLAQRLAPGTAYRLQVNTVRSLSGTVKSPSRQFVTPREAKKDTSAAVPGRRPPP